MEWTTGSIIAAVVAAWGVIVVVVPKVVGMIRRQDALESRVVSVLEALTAGITEARHEAARNLREHAIQDEAAFKALERDVIDLRRDQAESTVMAKQILDKLDGLKEVFQDRFEEMRDRLTRVEVARDIPRRRAADGGKE